MGAGRGKLEALIGTFPGRVRPVLESLRAQAGKLDSEQCCSLMERMEMDRERLMQRLLPLARAYARAPVSRFRVGAVAAAESGSPERFELYLGANMEFAGQSPETAVHAEQAALAHAWHQGARGIRSLAVSALPCGCCRQFLQELAGAPGLKVMVAPPGREPVCFSLDALLPRAFGPRDLGQSGGVMAPGEGTAHLELARPVDDGLVRGFQIGLIEY